MESTLHPPEMTPTSEGQFKKTAPRLLIDFKPSPKVIFVDRAASVLIRGFGIAVILAVALILLFIGKEAVPLFYTPKSEAVPTQSLAPLGAQARFLTWSVDEFQAYGYGLADDGHLYFISCKDGSVAKDLPIEELVANRPVVGWVAQTGNWFVAATKEGRLKFIQLGMNTEDSVLAPTIKESELIDVVPAVAGAPRPLITAVTASFNAISDTLPVAVRLQDGRFFTGVYNATSKSVEFAEVKAALAGKMTGMLFDFDARYLTLSNDAGLLQRWDLEQSLEKPAQEIRFEGVHVSSLNFLIGGFTYILGFSDGRVEAWFGVRKEEGSSDYTLSKIRDFESHASAVAGITPSGVDRSFWTWDGKGQLRMHFNPSAKRLYTFELGETLLGVAPNAHLNGLAVVTASNRLHQWKLQNPHSEITWKTLFGKVWYEGYAEPNYTWQSSSGSDNFEAKFSLTPLTVGTLKAAFFGLIFAIPISVFAALYTSQLMHPRIRSVIKPGIEIMAALPSVVIGFLAGLWIAPFLEKHLVAFGLVIPLFVILILTAAWAYYQIPLARRSGFAPEVEVGAMLGVVLLSLLLAHLLSGSVERTFFNGNIQQWIYDTFGQKVEQRNSLVIGIALGFAVIPIIFSISEDAMSNVPRHYVSGSLALGATRWQSAVRIVLPTASPGIFSAIMLGFGRAVGETMIVLMATGNTPIMSLSPFNGMRTLSANIAVEIPEAPHEGSLYRVLFLAAALLFLLTFILNTAAEIIRLRLRDKYRAM